ncbi:PAS domain S-box protein [Cesiribacter sp. SM1]|uniref:sensor histidine kinase n=1 Tax=Cesiribacter sp. SM1 TaxID=2861196 RepID=UPI001CD6557B|nr:PAS domain-containing sensor histidine kinase [Cesiribacter sp. SM1]
MKRDKIYSDKTTTSQVDFSTSSANLLILEEDEATYRMLVDSVKDYAIFMLDARGYIKTWNIGAQRLKGYDKEEIINKHFSVFYPEEALKINHPAYELEVASKVGRFEEEGWRVRKDGSLFWANVVISAVYNKDKQLIGFSKVTRDLTERKTLQDQLKESEERARLLIESVKDYAIFLLNPEGYVVTWNEGAKRIKGYEAHEIIGCHFSKFYPLEANPTEYTKFELATAIEQGRFEDEGWRVKKDGSKFWANVVITPIYNKEHQHIGFTKVTRDLSERVRNENLMKKNQELHRLNTDLDNFIYTASHDLKTPISNLEGLLTLMATKVGPKLDSTEEKFIELMATSVQKLNDTILSLLEVTKVQKDLNSKKEPVSVQHMLEDVKAELVEMINQFQVEIQEQLEVKEIMIARAHLRSILFNLLSNAIKYHSPERQPKIIIRTMEEDSCVVLSIKDNGLGLTKPQEAKLFGMFKRFHSHIGGMGIGLYIIKRIMDSLNGKIEVVSKLDVGTEFKLYFREHTS